MWGTFLFVMGLFGLFLINTFGVITTTNQQDYTLLKNAVEASMEDAIDWASYRAGFYLCLSDEDSSTVDVDTGVRNFNKKDDYYIVLQSKYMNHEQVKNCDLLIGKYKINRDVFIESFIRRFSNNINNNKSYQITIGEVIEYPPKVSVSIRTYNSYNSSESRTESFYMGDYGIVNQIDSILEEKS